MLFATIPAPDLFTVHELGSMLDDDGAVYGEVFWRAGDGSVKGPDNEPVELGMWRGLYAQLVSQCWAANRSSGSAKCLSADVLSCVDRRYP